MLTLPDCGAARTANLVLQKGGMFVANLQGEEMMTTLMILMTTMTMMMPMMTIIHHPSEEPLRHWIV